MFVHGIQRGKHYSKEFLRKQTLILVDKDFKTIVLNVFKDLRGNMKKTGNQKNNKTKCQY